MEIELLDPHAKELDGGEPRKPASGTEPPSARRNPRQRRNPVDEVIESGEIVERRSLIIRSASSPSLPAYVEEPPTEVSATPYVEPEVRSRRHYSLLVASLLLGASAIAASFVGGAKTVEPNLDVTASTIGAALDSEHKGRMVQAAALSSMLRIVIDTDEVTVADAIHSRDLVVPLEAGQVVQLTQINGGRRTQLLRLPTTAEQLPANKNGTHLVLDPAGVPGVIATVPVEPKAEIHGEVALWTPLDLAAMKRALPDQVQGATLEGLGSSIVLVKHSGTASLEATIKTKLTTAKPLVLAVVVSTPKTRDYTWLRNACGMASGALFLGFVIFAIRARRSSAAPA